MYNGIVLIYHAIHSQNVRLLFNKFYFEYKKNHCITFFSELSRRINDDVEEQRALATLGQTYFLKADSFTNPQSTEKAEALEHAKKYYMKSLQLCER